MKNDNQNAHIDDILVHHGISPGWDIIIFGDGSGSGWHMGGGFASIVINRHTGRREVITGSVSHGTSQLMELWPYIHALYWVSDNVAEAVNPRPVPGRPLRIHIFSDSELIVKQGNMEWGAKKMGPLWSSINDLCRRNGLTLRWHWAGRDHWGLNVLCDHISRVCRLHHDHVSIERILPEVDINQINPIRQPAEEDDGNHR